MNRNPTLLRAIAAALVGSAVMPLAQNASASFIGDEITLTLSVSYVTTPSNYVENATFTAASYPPGGTGFVVASASETGEDGYVATNVTMSIGTHDMYFNSGVSGITEPVSVTVTVGDIDWLGTPMQQIVGASVSFATTDVMTVQTGPDWVSFSYLASPAIPGQTRDFTSWGSLDLIWETTGVPEPSILMLIGIGLGSMAFAEKRRRRSQ